MQTLNDPLSLHAGVPMLDVLSGAGSKEYLVYLALLQWMASIVVLTAFVVRPTLWSCETPDLCDCNFASTSEVLTEYCCGYEGFGG